MISSEHAGMVPLGEYWPPRSRRADLGETATSARTGVGGSWENTRAPRSAGRSTLRGVGDDHRRASSRPASGPAPSPRRLLPPSWCHSLPRRSCGCGRACRCGGGRTGWLGDRAEARPPAAARVVTEAAAYRFPLGCLGATLLRRSSSPAGDATSRAGPCWHYGVYLTVVLRWVDGVWRLMLAARSDSCRRTPLRAAIRALLVACAKHNDKVVEVRVRVSARTASADEPPTPTTWNCFRQMRVNPHPCDGCRLDRRPLKKSSRREIRGSKIPRRSPRRP